MMVPRNPKVRYGKLRLEVRDEPLPEATPEMRATLEEFAERQQHTRDRDRKPNKDEDDAVALHAKYMPPWRDRLLTGKLGPWHGPRTEGELMRQMAEHSQSRDAVYGGGGLWDKEIEMAEDEGKQAREGRKAGQRYDAEDMRVFVERYSAELPDRELEVYVLFYRDMRGKGACAREMGLKTRHGVDNLIQSLRGKMRAWKHRRKGR